MKRFLCLLLVLLLVVFPFAGCMKKSEEIPAAPPPPLVEDRAGVLTDSTVARIEQEGAVLRDLTGSEILIVTEEFLGGSEIDAYAAQLFLERQPGLLKNNGLLLLLCTKQEDYSLTVGQGLGEGMNQERLLSLLDQATESDFAAQNYDTAARKTFDLLKAELEGLYGVSVSDELSRRAVEAAQPAKGEGRSLWILLPIVCFALACLMFLLCLIGRRMRRRNV